MVVAAPLPLVGRGGMVELGGVPLAYIEETYLVEEAERFGQKISIGPLSYGDFTPHESSYSFSLFPGGYGLRRSSDLEDPRQAAGYYLEADGVDASGVGIHLAPLLTTETLPNSTAPVVWLGEFTPSGGTAKWVAVAGTKIYTRNSDGTWTDTGLALPAGARRGAVGVFDGKLVIGFGAAATAKYTADLSTLNDIKDDAGPPANNLYVFAFTSDRASAYIAGGTDSTQAHVVWSSTNGSVYATSSKTTCGTKDSAITSLSPGGGVAIVFVGKETELGEIDTAGIYRVLVPFDSRLSTNASPARWWMGSGGQEQRGPLILIFPRERSLWAYQPSSEQTGTAENISPWAKPFIRPLNARGRPTAVQGAARWLYVAIQTQSGTTWILRRDARSGAWHSWFSLGNVSCEAIGITSLFGGLPLLFLGKGNDVVSLRLPADGESPLDDANSRYASQGDLYLPDIDLGFVDEDKVVFGIRLVAENLKSGEQEIQVSYSLDGGSYTLLGAIVSGPSGELVFSPNPTAKRIGLRLRFITTNNTKTPILLGGTVRLSLNTRLYRVWSFDALLPWSGTPTLADNLHNPKTDLDALWAARESGTPVTFVDRWGTSWLVRIVGLREQGLGVEAMRTPETRLSVRLLQFQLTTGNELPAGLTSPTESLGTLTESVTATYPILQALWGVSANDSRWGECVWG